MASAYAVDRPGGKLMADAEKLRQGAVARLKAAESSGLIVVSGRTVALAVPPGVAGAQAMLAQARSAMGMLATADSMEAEGRRLAQAGTPRHVPGVPTVSLPTGAVPVAAGVVASGAATSTAYAGPTYRPGSVLAASAGQVQPLAFAPIPSVSTPSPFVVGPARGSAKLPVTLLVSLGVLSAAAYFFFRGR